MLNKPNASTYESCQNNLSQSQKIYRLTNNILRPRRSSCRKIFGLRLGQWQKSQKSNFSFIFMLKSRSVSECSWRLSTITLSSNESKWIALILAVKKTIWLQLLFTKLGVLQVDQQHPLIKISERNKCAKIIPNDRDNTCRETSEIPRITISFKSDK